MHNEAARSSPPRQSPAAQGTQLKPAAFYERPILNSRYEALTPTPKAKIDPVPRATHHSGTSRPFARPASGRIAVKVINHLGDEVPKVFRV